MANELQELLNEIRDTRLKERLEVAVEQLRKNKKFGLVFERHIPELLPIYSAKIRSHSRVARKDGLLTETFVVDRVAKGVATVKPEQGEGEPQNIPISELFVVKRFGEAIFPALRHVESVPRGGDAPHHALIEADNYHALQLLEWLYTGKVDCIYIDPPYNTGARDWKYNNDYVDDNDDWRHSKWLAFMERRLKLAKRLLKPDNSVLIVTIDEKEYLRLGLLLGEVFPECKVQMVNTQINPASVARAGAFGRSDEFIFFVTMGAAAPQRVKLSREWVSDKGRTHTGNLRWDMLRRSGTNASRSHSPGCFYPIYVDPDGPRIGKVGDPLPAGTSKAKEIPGLVPVLPIRKNGSEGNWQWSPETLLERQKQGRVRISGSAKKRFVVSILKEGEYAKFLKGEYTEIGRNSDGSIIVDSVNSAFVLAVPGSQWRISSHDATQYGSRLLTEILPDRSFPFPKSLYAVKDAIRFFTDENKSALILDFFAGSGTTLNAVTLLNAIDGGQRRCILVTNNEVSAKEAETLRGRGLQPGDGEWESLGICHSVTWPRSKFTTLGRRDDGTELRSEYLTGRFEEQEIRRAVRPLDFASTEALASKKERESLAAAVGFPKSMVTGKEPFLLSENEEVAVLLDPDALENFIERGEECAETIETVYLPFPSGKAFNQARDQVLEAWPPLTKPVEVKRPMKDGFAANLEYFRLDFLDRAQAETGGKLADILPALWMMAGCRGKIPNCKGNEKMLFFKDCPFAILVEESAIKLFLAKLEERKDIDWVFLVTNDQDSFSRMCEWLPEHIPATQRIHLWRNYVDNFLINVDHAAGEAL